MGGVRRLLNENSIPTSWYKVSSLIPDPRPSLNRSVPVRSPKDCRFWVRERGRNGRRGWGLRETRLSMGVRDDPGRVRKDSGEERRDSMTRARHRPRDPIRRHTPE